MNDKKRIRTRFAPSPTGYLHIGGVRSALYPELLAKQNNGDFILRIEDTDRSRYVEGSVENLVRTLKQLNIKPNEGVWLDEAGTIIQRGDKGPYIQSERQKIHQKYAEELVKMDKAYYCFCSQERLEEIRRIQEATKQPTGYDGHCRNLTPQEVREKLDNGEPYVIRLKLPQEGTVEVQDTIRGKVKFDWKLIDDSIILKSDGMPTYHLASMVDDHDMEITHVIRGEEWLPSTPKHIFIYQAFNWDLPVFAHLPLILNEDKSKLSKRQGDVATESYLEKGYLPEALINFIALLGWNPKGDQEIYSHQELIELFNLEKVNKSGAIFRIDKLNWLNNYYLRKMDEERYYSLTLPFLNQNSQDIDFKKRIALLFRDRLTLPSEIVELSQFFFNEKLDYSEVSITWKDHSKKEAQERLQECLNWIQKIPDDQQYQVNIIDELFRNKIKEKEWGNGDTLWPLRVALSGQKKSPSPFDLIATYGKQRSIQRIEHALEALKI